MRILGVDPGLRRTGYGIIDVKGTRLHYVASGTIVVPGKESLAERLHVILSNLRDIAQQAKPDQAALEKVFLNVNPATTLLLGQARGAALCALAEHKLLTHEYTALQIKKALVGTGRASKRQVQAMVSRLLNLNGTPAPDAADALACAICHAHCAPVAGQLQQLAPGSLSTRRRRLRSGRLLS